MMIGKRLQSDKVLTVDCDDTLVMWDLSKYPDLPKIEMDCYGPVQLIVNQKNVNTVRKFHKLGWTVIIWSQTGADWAESVSKAVGLHDIATLYLTKPRYYIDDLPSSEWMGEKIWRDPVSGDSE